MPAKRVLISIDERILARIDDAAQRTGQTRSGFLAQAAIAQIDAEGAGAETRSKESLRALTDHPDSRR